VHRPLDEDPIQLRPVVVNVGDHLFDGLKARKDFELIEAIPLKEGSIFVKYKPVNVCLASSYRNRKAKPESYTKICRQPKTVSL
jgi:hypothetical protein